MDDQGTAWRLSNITEVNISQLTFESLTVSSEGKMGASHLGGSPGFIEVVEDGAILLPELYRQCHML